MFKTVGTRLQLAGSALFVAEACARGTALFLGLFSVLNAVAVARAGRASQDLWWIDLRSLPAAAALSLGALTATALAAYGFAPRMAPWRRRTTVAACVALAAFALRDSISFFQLAKAGTFEPGVPFPLSLPVAVVLGLLAWAAWALPTAEGRPAWRWTAVGCALAALAIVFPLAQVAFFGGSDYRARSDAAVIFGAQVNSGGGLSASLADRVNTGIALYRAGYAKKLVMSGAVGASGLDEPLYMARYAEQAGVPAKDILLDHQGWNTDDTVANTVALFRRDGIRSVLAVSQGYHLPRVKLAYAMSGWDVRTVPAPQGPVPIPQTPLFVAREVPAFWTYWLRALVGDIVHG